MPESTGAGGVVVLIEAGAMLGPNYVTLHAAAFVLAVTVTVSVLTALDLLTGQPG